MNLLAVHVREQDEMVVLFEIILVVVQPVGYDVEDLGFVGMRPQSHAVLDSDRRYYLQLQCRCVRMGLASLVLLLVLGKFAESPGRELLIFLLVFFEHPLPIVRHEGNVFWFVGRMHEI